MSSWLDAARDGEPDPDENTPRSTSSDRVQVAYLRTLDDAQLVSQLISGIHDALTVLFERHSATVFRVARRMLRDDGEAEETVQQVFFDVYRAVKQFDEEKGTFRTWLLQFAYHRSMNRKEQLQSQRVNDWIELDEALPAELFAGAKRPLHLDPLETGRLIRQLLSTIKPRQRRTIELTFFEGLTAEEIAKRTGESPAAVRHNLYRGMQKLRLALTERPQEQKQSPRKGNVEKGAIFVVDTRPL
jgi:RNA polymerase sigma-70 factor (ECF subfamily)